VLSTHSQTEKLESLNSQANTVDEKIITCCANFVMLMSFGFTVVFLRELHIASSSCILLKTYSILAGQLKQYDIVLVWEHSTTVSPLSVFFQKTVNQ
jgi:hypothetical protein